MANERSGGFCEALLARVDGDEQIFAELCDIFLDDAPKRLAAIRAALEAGNAAALRAAAHAFKGAAGVFDAEQIVALARRLEVIGAEGNLPDGEAVWAELETLSFALIDEIRSHREATA